jgi:hypothetical protein
VRALACVCQSFRAIGMIGSRSLPDDVRKLYSVLGKQPSPLLLLAFTNRIVE